MLSCLNLSKKYGKILFNELNINLEKGEILAVIGPSGCGKTTLLRCICGLEELDSGKILLNQDIVLFNQPRPAETTPIKSLSKMGFC